MCGSKFRISKANPRYVGLNFRLGVNLDSGEFTVPGKGEYVLIADTTGTVRVYEGTNLVGSALNGGIVCK
jgi:hypothetical protein